MQWVTIGALLEIVLTKKLKWFFVRKVLISVMNMSANAVYIQIWHQSYPAQDIFLSESSLSDCNHPVQFDLGRPNLCQRAILPTTSGLQPPDLIICCHQLALSVIWCHYFSLLVICYHHLSLPVIWCHQFSLPVVCRHQFSYLSSTVISCFYLWSAVIRCFYLAFAVINFLWLWVLSAVINCLYL